MEKKICQVYVPTGFPCFDTQLECDKYMDNMKECVITTLTTWDEIITYLVKPLTLGMANEKDRSKKADISIVEKKSNIFYGTKVRLFPNNLAKSHVQVNLLDCIKNSLRYLFFHIQNGLYVKIHDNQVTMFVPFSNIEYCNVYDGKEWSADGSLLYNQHLKHKRQQVPLKNGRLLVILDMLIQLCKNREIPNIDFFINTNGKHPVLKKDNSEPNNRIFPNDAPLLREKHDMHMGASAYAPIFSFAGDNYSKFADIIVPSHEDWLVATGKLFPKNHALYADQLRMSLVKWNEKLPICFFRGKACHINDQRMSSLLKLSLCENKETIYDVGITEMDAHDELINDMLISSEPDCRLFHKEFIPIGQFGKYKYLLYIPGHDGYANSGKYSYFMGLQSVIFKVASPIDSSSHTAWFFKLLKPMFDHIPVKADLSDLEEKLKWAKTHELECMEMAFNACKFKKKYLSTDAILDFWQYTLNELSRNTHSKTGIENALPSNIKKTMKKTTPNIPSVKRGFMTLEEKEEAELKKFNKKNSKEVVEKTKSRYEAKALQWKEMKSLIDQNRQVYKLSNPQEYI